MEKINATDSLAKSEDLVAQNIEQLKALFPEITAEGKIDFKVLKHILGEEIEEEEEYYRFTWAGKSQARMEAHKPSTGTLRPAKDESVDWDTTQNLYIEGDNLEVLKLLQKSYAGKVKMIYIDPPYNTGKDFVYKDNYKDNLRNYQEVTGQVDSEGNKLSTNSESDGRYHSNWLNMMYPRLRLARNLLKEDGVIFISIDDNEVENLKKECSEIFGESNFIAQLPTVMNLKGNNDQFGFAGTHEYTLVFGKNIDEIEDLHGIPLDESDMDDYKHEDNKGKYKKGATLMRTGEAGAREKRPRGFYPIYVSKELNRISIERRENSDIEVFPLTKNGKEMSWRRSPEKLKETLDEFIITGNAENIGFYKKQRLEDDLLNGKKAKSLFYKPEYSSGNGTEIVKSLFGERVFDNPKPISLLKDLISIGCPEGIFLDFFSGSASSAHAILELNLNDKSNRSFIQVQLPEKTDSKSEAFKAGFKTITEIGKERIRRAANKIAAENPEKAKDLDLGFKVFKLDSSNIRPWDGNPDNLEDDLFNSGDNIKTDRSSEDVLYEILLKYGLDLTLPIEERDIEGQKVFSVGYGALFICLDKEIKGAVADGIGKWKEELQPELCRVIFRDAGFTDVGKTNATQTLKRYGITEVRSV
jgi:adenine-specific DNA-methyltransferase